MESKFISSVQKILKREGINVVIGNIKQRKALWENWYRGNVNDFHYYKRKVNGIQKKFERLTLNLPKKICEDWSSYVFGENSQLTAIDVEQNKILQYVLEKNNFYTEINDFLEMVEALGNGATICYIKDGMVKIDFITGDNLYITSQNNGIVTGIITLSISNISEKSFLTHVTSHSFEKNEYTIKHYIYISSDKNDVGKQVNNFGDYFEKDFIDSFNYDEESAYLYQTYNINYPFFQFWKPNIKNNWDIDSPYGISRFANSIDDFKKADIAHDLGYVDMKNGKSRLFFDKQIATEQVIGTTKSDGTPGLSVIHYFDDDDDTLMMVNGLKDPLGNGKALEKYTPELKVEISDRALINAINLACWNCGFGTNYYEMKNGKMTAKEVIHSDSQLWRNVVKSQNKYKSCLVTLAKSVLSLFSSIGKNTIIQFSDKDINMIFDDSIVIDDESKKELDFNLIDRNMLPKYIFLMKWCGYSEEEAKKLIKEAEEEAQAQFSDAYPVLEDLQE